MCHKAAARKCNKREGDQSEQTKKPLQKHIRHNVINCQI